MHVPPGTPFTIGGFGLGSRECLFRALVPGRLRRHRQRLPDRLQEKHDRETEEGRALRALCETRVRAAPSWDADAVEIQLWFIREPDDGAPGGERGEAFLEAWLELVTPGGRFRSVDGVVTSLDDVTARDYVESDPLDLDHLSARER